MTTALVTMVKDEVDIISPFLKHHAWHVDALYVADHGSTDGTRDILANPPVPVTVTVTDITDPGYWQSRYMTQLALQALEDGHKWVIASDVDEIWYVGADIHRRIRDFFDGLAPDALVVNAEMYHHIPTSDDERGERNPFYRIGWRQRERGALPKIACRLHPNMLIEPGNHGVRLPGGARPTGGLVIRHFSWRSPAQFVRKIRNGIAAYNATDLPATYGDHWRSWEGKSDEQIVEHYETWFHVRNPRADPSLIFDPAPVRG